MPYPDISKKYSNPLHGHCHPFVESFSPGTIHHYIYAMLLYSGAKQGCSSKTVVIPEVVMGMLY